MITLGVIMILVGALITNRATDPPTAILGMWIAGAGIAILVGTLIWKLGIP
jgi:hypothetical protein